MLVHTTTRHIPKRCKVKQSKSTKMSTWACVRVSVQRVLELAPHLAKCNMLRLNERGNGVCMCAFPVFVLVCVRLFLPSRLCLCVSERVCLSLSLSLIPFSPSLAFPPLFLLSSSFLPPSLPPSLPSLSPVQCLLPRMNAFKSARDGCCSRYGLRRIHLRTSLCIPE